MITEYEINIKKGQAINLLNSKDEKFLDRLKELDKEVYKEIEELTIALFIADMRINLVEKLIEHPVISTELDPKIKYKKELQKSS